MIGTSVVIGDSIKNVKGLNRLKESWHQYECLIKGEHITASIISYNGYPIDCWSYNDFLIVVEGIIFNIRDEDLKKQIETIIDNRINNRDILGFINNADGDFCIFIVNQKTNETVVFNDILGGLPLFYSQEDSIVYISRQFGIIASNLNERKWSKTNIAEFLTLGNNLRNRTFSDCIFKFEPASILRASYNDKIYCHYENLYVDDFALTNQYKTKHEAIIDLVKLFKESCRIRVEYANNHGYRIVNTISGGFDSRTIVGGLEKYISDYVNVTYEYLQDESVIAKRVLDAINSTSTYIKLNFKNSPDIYDRRLTFNTDGRINSYTNSICYHDMLSVREYFGNDRILFFGGFGGEFIRHPKYETMLPFAKRPEAYSPTFYLTSNVCKTELKAIKQLFNDTFYHHSNSGEDRLKDFYNEYYQNLVRCSGEDRGRMFYYSVHPMMGKDFIMAIRHRVPLKWAGFEFYKSFLLELDSRLLTVNIFGQGDGYLEDKSLKRIDFKKQKIEYFSSVIRYYLQKYKRKELKNDERTVLYNDISNMLDAIDDLGIFNKDFISSNYQGLSKSFKHLLIAAVSFVYSIEKHEKYEL